MKKKINKTILKRLDTINLNDVDLKTLFLKLQTLLNESNGEDVEYRISFDNNVKIPVGGLVPEIIFRLKEKEGADVL